MNLYRRTQQLQGAERTMQKAEKAMREICKAIGKELRQMREDRHIKQVTLAKQLGISPSHLFEIEDGSVMLDEKRLKQIYWQINKMRDGERKTTANTTTELSDRHE